MSLNLIMAYIPIFFIILIVFSILFASRSNSDDINSFCSENGFQGYNGNYREGFCYKLKENMIIRKEYSCIDSKCYFIENQEPKTMKGDK